MKASSISNQQGSYLIFCPGCGCGHKFDARWTFNGDFEKPTFSPSLLVNGRPEFHNPAVPRCHSFVTDGRIHFLGDCEHEMKGQTVELPDF
jgi:hypothetical protein